MEDVVIPKEHQVRFGLIAVPLAWLFALTRMPNMASSLVLTAVIGLVAYRLVRPRPFLRPWLSSLRRRKA